MFVVVSVGLSFPHRQEYQGADNGNSDHPDKDIVPTFIRVALVEKIDHESYADTRYDAACISEESGYSVGCGCCAVGGLVGCGNADKGLRPVNEEPCYGQYQNHQPHGGTWGNEQERGHANGYANHAEYTGAVGLSFEDFIGNPSTCQHPDNPDDIPDIIVAAFDLSLTYSRLCRAAWWIAQGILYIATNPDRVCPTNQPTILVDCGSICKCLEHATGRRPDITLGKPDPNMLIGILQQKNLHPQEIAMVGDRIYTDIAMAQNAGAVGILVLSGETTIEIAQAADNPPDLIVKDIEELGILLDKARP